MRTTPNLPFFVPGTSKDVTFMKQLATESCQLFNREIQVKFINRVETPVDELYGETKNPVYDPFFVRANVELIPKKAKLTKMGIDEPRDLLVFINEGVLTIGSGPAAEVGSDDPRATELGGYPVPEPGDLFIVEDEEYKILDQQRWDYNWHTETYNTYAFSCERHRPRSVDDAVPVDPLLDPTGAHHVPTLTDNDFPGEGC